MSQFLAGLFFGAYIAFMFILWMSTGNIGHQVGTEQSVCMTIEDRQVDDVYVKRTKCMKGTELLAVLRGSK